MPMTRSLNIRLERDVSYSRDNAPWGSITWFLPKPPVVVTLGCEAKAGMPFYDDSDISELKGW